MTTLLSILPLLACVAMMFGAGAIARLAARTPLGRLRSRRRHDQLDANDGRAPAANR